MRRTGAAIRTMERRIVGHTESGDGLSMNVQRTDVQKVFGSAHKITMGGNVVALDGTRRCTQNKETGQNISIDHKKGQGVVSAWVPTTEKETVEEQNKILKGDKLAIPPTESEEPGFSRQVKRP